MSDPDARMTVAYVMNQMADRDRREDDRGMEIVMAAYGGLHRQRPGAGGAAAAPRPTGLRPRASVG